MARPAAARNTRVSSWVGQPLVVCEGGPLASRWYFAAWWRRQADGAADMVARGGQSRSIYLEYAATDATREHPTEPTRGQVLRWTRRKGVSRV